MKLKKDDPVIVICGNDRGKEGKIVAIQGDKVVVQGVQLRKKHQKSRDQKKGGSIVTSETPIHISNVSYSDNGKPVKLRVREVEGKKEVFIRTKDREEKVIRKI
ncbi:MAG: 50S ribosomal protein L24 [Verrucomicrobia bacterium]|nr:50S ribosomal protein L24 [Verrucomicrobiota bacterium]